MFDGNHDSFLVSRSSIQSHWSLYIGILSFSIFVQTPDFSVFISLILILTNYLYLFLHHRILTVLLQEEHLEVHCSREKSLAAWKIIEEYLTPFVEKKKFQLSSKCRLHPSNDIFRDQENHKIHMDISEWQCGYCKNSFRAEKYLDQHFDNRHYNLLNVSDGKCLADQCGALHCDFVANSQSRKSKCNPAAAARNRHLCEDLADSCFPFSDGPSATQLHEFFLRQFCDAHTCSRGSKPFSRGGKKHTSIFYLAISVLIMMFLPIFYLIVYLYQREMRIGTQQLKRISKPGKKSKSS